MTEGDIILKQNDIMEYENRKPIHPKISQLEEQYLTRNCMVALTLL